MSKCAELANLIGNINAGGGGANKNLIINGNMVCSQRGTSATNPGGGYATVDRYRHSQNSSGLGNFTSEQVTDAPDGTGLTKSFKFTKSGATTMGSGQSAFIEQYIEEKNCQILEYGTSDAKTTTLSFYVKSSLTGTFGISLARLIGGSFTHSHVKTYTISSANTWEYKSVTITGNTSQDLVGVHSFNVRFCLGAGTDRQATADTWHSSDEHTTSAQTQLPETDGASWQLTGVQFEIGQNATTFEHEPFANTLRKCQRYYEKSYNQDTTPGTSTHLGSRSTGGNQAANTTGEIGGYFPFIVTKRAAPTMTIYDQSGNSGKTTISLYGTGTTANQTSSVSNMSETVFFVSRGSAGSPANATELYVQFEADSEL